MHTARRLEIPVFSGFHTNFQSYSRFYGAGWLQPLIMRYLRGFHNRTHGTLVPSVGLREQLQATGFKNVSVLDRGVDSRSSMIWFVKVITDPLTDLMAYMPRYITAYKALLPSTAPGPEEKWPSGSCSWRPLR